MNIRSEVHDTVTTYQDRAQEEFDYCQWIVERRPPYGQEGELWLQEREAYRARRMREKAHENAKRSALDARDPVAQADRELTFYRAVLTAALVAGKRDQAEDMRKAIAFWEQRRATVQDWERP